MILSLTDLFGELNLVALVSDREVDFALRDDGVFLTDFQKQALEKELGAPVVRVAWARQVHGARVVSAAEEFFLGENLCEADALLTAQVGLPIAVRTADCLPVFIFDPLKNVIGVAHAGWKGAHQEILVRTIEQMSRDWGSEPQDLKIVFGPAIRSCCYQVGEEFVAYFPWDVQKKSTGLYLDLVSVNRRQALRAGVLEKHVSDVGICTCCDSRFFSYRREGQKAGRMLSLMMLKG